MSAEDCKKLRDDIYSKNDKLREELLKYDPIADSQGGFPMRWGIGFTRPGGHYKEIRDLQRGLKRDLERYNRYCCNNGDGNPPIARNVDQLANWPVEEPPLPMSDMPYFATPQGPPLGSGRPTPIFRPSLVVP